MGVILSGWWVFGWVMQRSLQTGTVENKNPKNNQKTPYL
ncbi:hypothetical protein [uncultured Gammaproteobacteria bacterium]|nr:hypothetical protein [uncultured Gammaproteobacteria bacterium]